MKTRTRKRPTKFHLSFLLLLSVLILGIWEIYVATLVSSDDYAPVTFQNQTTTVMPRLDFPSLAPISANDLILASNTSLGGCESKFILRHATRQETFIFKPSHGAWLSQERRYEFRPSKGGLVHLQKFHPPKILNELIAYITNEILEIHRIPPVVAWAANESVLFPNTSPSAKSNHFWGCRMDFSSTNQWLRTNSQEIIGTLQLKIEGVQALGRWHWLWNPLPERELNTRTIFDYVVGNWDRGFSNNFIWDGKLVYIDQNALRKDLVPFDLWERLVGSKCRFYATPIERLRQQTDLASQIRQSLSQKLPIEWKLAKLGPLVNINARVQTILEYVGACLERHGQKHVFLN